MSSPSHQSGTIQYLGAAPKSTNTEKFLTCCGSGVVVIGLASSVVACQLPFLLALTWSSTVRRRAASVANKRTFSGPRDFDSTEALRFSNSASTLHLASRLSSWLLIKGSTHSFGYFW